MENKVVFWGRQNDKKVLIVIKANIALEKVIVSIFKGETIDGELLTAIKNEWDGNIETVDILNLSEYSEVATTFNFKKISDENWLPEHTITDDSLGLRRIQSEWNFFAITEKLCGTYLSELSELESVILEGKYEPDEVKKKVSALIEKITGQIKEGNFSPDREKLLSSRLQEVVYFIQYDFYFKELENIKKFILEEEYNLKDIKSVIQRKKDMIYKDIEANKFTSEQATVLREKIRLLKATLVQEELKTLNNDDREIIKLKNVPPPNDPYWRQN